MGSASCELQFHTRNSAGEVVESRLFNDLLHYTSDRATAKEFYAVGINERFLEKVKDKATFDENGEITFKSLRQLAGLNVEKEKELITLNKDIGSGKYSYTDAMVKLQNFNRTNPYNDKYMALITQLEGDQFDLRIVERTEANEAQLVKLVGNRNLIDRLKFALNKAGVDYTFLEEGEKGNGRYSTKNAVQTADGLYQLIKVANNEVLVATLAEEAGHFAIGALGNSPLVARLIDMLTPEVQQAALGEEAANKYLGLNGRREVAGTLVGRALAGEIDKRAPWQSLVNRIVDLIKRVFHNIMGNDIALAKISAQSIAEQIAQGFMSPDFKGTVETALETKETLYNAPDSFNVKTFKKIAARLRLQATAMKAVNRDLYTKYNRLASQAENKVTLLNAGVHTDLMALEGIAEAAASMADLMIHEIPSTLASVDFDNISDFTQNMVRNGKALRHSRIFVSNAKALIEIIHNSAPRIEDAIKLVGDIRNIESLDEDGNKVSHNLLTLADTLNKGLTGSSGLIAAVTTKEAQFYLKFLENSLGSSFVTRAARLLFNTKPGQPLIKFKEAQKYTVAEAMEGLESDITPFERYLASMANSSDLIGQIVDKVVKLSNKWADDLSNRAQEELLLLQKELEALDLTSTEMFVEKSAVTGKLTGNFISPVNWGDYEDDWAKMKKEAEKEFLEKNPNIKDLPDFQKAILWDKFFKPKAKLWHKGNAFSPAHSQWDDIGQRYVPSTKYKSAVYESTIKGTPYEKWLNKLMELKETFDKRLPEGATKAHRMPQFKGTFMNKIQNKRLFENTNKAVINTMRASIRDTFMEDSEDTEFGSDETYNSIEDDMFLTSLSYEREKVNRIPLFGINKLKDMSELSTDLFHSMFAYAGMANSYLALSQVADTLEVGGEVLSRRTVGGILSEQDSQENKSRAYNRYMKYLEKQVYGIGVKKTKLGKSLVLNKVAGFLSGLASKVFLGGNVAGGLVNIGTGSIEIFKEAIAGEHINLKDWSTAHKVYFENLPDNLWDGLTGVQIQTNKVALFIRHANILGKSKQEQRDWHTNEWRLTRANPLGGNLFLPYKAGEHYMQSIPYLALASTIKLYDKDGMKLSLLNAYKVVDLGDGVKTLKITQNAEDFHVANSIKAKVLTGIQKGQTFEELSLTTPEADYLKKKHYKFNSLQELSQSISMVLEQDSIFFKEAAGKSKYNTLTAIADKLEHGGTLTTEEQNLANLLGYNLAKVDQTLVQIQEAKAKLIWSIDDESDFTNKAREISNRMHGIYNNIDKVAFQQTLFGNMLLAMKGYALGLAERRFSQSKYSVALDQESEGSLVTAAKVIMSTFTDKGGFKLTLQSLFLPFGDKAKANMIAAGFSPNQFYNMRRNLGDYVFIGLLAVLRMLTAKGEDDDDEEEGSLTGIAYYFAYRLFREQAAYALPPYMRDEAQNLTSAFPAGFSVVVSLSQLAEMFGGAMLSSDTENAKYYYQSTKNGLYEEGDAKWEKKFKRMVPYIRSSYIFEHPYDAAASFEYGRRLRTN